MADAEQAVEQAARPLTARRRALRVALVVGTAVVLAAMLSRAPGGRAADVLLQADVSWVLTATAVSVLPVLAMTGALTAMTARPLPVLRTTLVQLATSFTNVLAPAGAGGAALNARFLHCLGLPLAESVAVVAVVQLTSVLTTVVFLALVLVGTGELSDAVARLPLETTGWLLLAGAAVLLVGLRWQPARALLGRRLAAPVKRSWPQLRQALASPARLTALVGSHLLVTAGLGLTLWCCLRAFEVDLAVTAMLLALLAGSAVGSAAPVPGGIGTVEAATAAALLTAGVPAADAVAIALLYRLITFWGRLAPGWASLVWLRRQGAV